MKNQKKGISIEAPVYGVSLQNAAGLTSTLPSWITPVQPVILPANLLKETSNHLPMQVDLATSKLSPNEQCPSPIQEGAEVQVQLPQESQRVHTRVGGGISFQPVTARPTLLTH